MEPKILLFRLLGAIWILGLVITTIFIIRAKIKELERLRDIKYHKEEEYKDEIQ